VSSALLARLRKNTQTGLTEVGSFSRRGAVPVLPNVEDVTIPLAAGMISTVLFAVSVLPMLAKAWRTQDLSSYSLGNMVTSNVANLVHAVYVFSLPMGPIWLLHSFYLIATALMLFWYLRYRQTRSHARRPHLGSVGTMITTRSTLTEQELAA
jgi:uncharacterized protein with PQ loop repeat